MSNGGPSPDGRRAAWGFGFLLEPERRFLISAVVLMAVLYGAYYYPYDPQGAVNRAIEAYLRLQAWAAAGLIQLFDPAVRVEQTLISGRFPIQIVKSCSSLDAQALFVAAVLAFPARIRAKALGLAAGVLAVTLLNLTRIAGLYFVGLHAPGSFDSVHEEILPLVLVAFACVAFAVWARWARGVAVVAG